MIPEARSRSSITNAAVVFLALGAQANQMNCPAAIETLVRYAGWDGDVYLITDRPHCFSAESIVRNAGMDSDKLHLKHVTESFSTGGYDVYGRLGSRAMRVKSLSMKTRLFEFVDKMDIDTIMYADCDILFGQERCVTKLIEENSKTWANFSIRFSHTSFKPNGKLNSIHSGVFLAHRIHSADALKRWGQQFRKGIHEHDCDAYIGAYEQKQLELESAITRSSLEDDEGKNNREDERNVTLWHHKRKRDGRQPFVTEGGGRQLGRRQPPAAPVVNLTDPGIKWNSNPLNTQDLRQTIGGLEGGRSVLYEEFFKGDVAAPPRCMNHITKARCTLLGREQVQEYVRRFQLRTYEGRYHFCPHQTVAPLMYGWFPFAYVPFCPKLETLW
jgi:hypothetical protein